MNLVDTYWLTGCEPALIIRSMIKDSKTRVTFVTKKETHEKLQEIVERLRKDGRKQTVSSLIDDIIVDYIKQRDFFGVDGWPS